MLGTRWQSCDGDRACRHLKDVCVCVYVCVCVFTAVAAITPADIRRRNTIEERYNTALLNCVLILLYVHRLVCVCVCACVCVCVCVCLHIAHAGAADLWHTLRQTWTLDTCRSMRTLGIQREYEDTWGSFFILVPCLYTTIYRRGYGWMSPRRPHSLAAASRRGSWLRHCCYFPPPAINIYKSPLRVSACLRAYSTRDTGAEVQATCCRRRAILARVRSCARLLRV
jgi:hypothetical protein